MLLRMRNAHELERDPQIIAQSTGWRFVREPKRQIKG